MSNVVGLFGLGKSMTKAIFYYGAYKLTNSFDLASLDGLIRFSEGHLVERITILKLKDDVFDEKVNNYLKQLRDETQNS